MDFPCPLINVKEIMVVGGNARSNDQEIRLAGEGEGTLGAPRLPHAESLQLPRRLMIPDVVKYGVSFPPLICG